MNQPHLKLHLILQPLPSTFHHRPWFFPDSMKIMYHDIVVDIPEGSRRVVREMYYCWLGLCFCLFFNWICASTILSTGDAYKVRL